tara:strand:+ start:1984 stop:2265 length:282 start_codon:yes stop_codon:yes gene_type:complete
MPIEFGAYASETGFIVKILTGGGGLGNGNAYSELELHFDNESEWENMEPANKIYYVEYGKNAVRTRLSETYYHFKDDEDVIVLKTEEELTEIK